MWVGKKSLVEVSWISEVCAGDVVWNADFCTVGKVAAANVASREFRSWCEVRLRSFFNDEDDKVRRESASSIRQVRDEALQRHEGLIAAFCDSRAYRDDSFSIGLQVGQDSLESVGPVE